MTRDDALETGYAPLRDQSGDAYSHGKSSVRSLPRGGSSLAVNSPVDEANAADAGVHITKPRGSCQLFWSRFWDTLSVCVFKIFCGGFVWQGGAFLSAALHNSVRRDNSFGTFVLTGLGDGLGVFTGAMLWALLSYPCVRAPPKLKPALRVALFLGSASFCSGFMWQLFVNISTNLRFWGCAAVTGAVCGSAFLSGLRLGRLVYGRLCGWIEVQGTPFLKDFQLALSVAGASFCFVCTDDYFHHLNPMPFLEVKTDTPKGLGMFNAGLSTFIGFFIVQMIQNTVLFRLDGASWLDAGSDKDDEREGSANDEWYGPQQALR